MGSALSIRPLAVSDRTQWDRLWRGYLEFYETSLPPHVSDVTFGRLLKASEPIHGLVAEADNRIVGFAHYLLHRSTWSDSYCYLEDLFAAPAMRGIGIGRALIEAVEAAAREAGATRLYWVTRADNAVARRLYDRVATATDFVQYRKAL
jgi:GNAT superfamily N-acetyltransferase